MNPKNTAKVFLTLISLFLVCTPSAHASDHVQYQTGIIDGLKNSWHTVQFCGEVVLSETFHIINQLTSAHADGDNVTAQADLDFWNDLKAQYPFSERPVFISMDSVCGPAYDHAPKGVSEVTVVDNSENILDSYSVTKNETGFIIQKGAPGNPDHNCTITVRKIKELDGTYGNIGQIKASKMYVKEQIQEQIEAQA